MGAPITLNFSWTSAGNFPAGSNAWNGQPLALAPANTYMTPNTKPAAEEINYEFGQIATDLANINNAIPVWNSHTFSGATDSIVVPAGVTWMVVELVGGGGGGEGGKRGETGGVALGIFPQGGGGAGAPLVTAILPVTPGETINWTQGAGGTAGSANGGNGGDGGSSLVSTSVSDNAVEAYGGAGCGSGFENNQGTGHSCGLTDTPGSVYTDILAAFAPGAVGVARIAPSQRPFPYSLGPVLFGSANTFLSHANSNVPGSGGGTGVGNQVYPTGTYAFIAYPGAQPTGSLIFGGLPHVGGNPGTAGTQPGGSPSWPGCAGGGGGGSVFGDGGNGGNGGTAGSAGSGQVGGNATAGGDGDLGAGGGGGGCGGDGTTSGGTSGAGGKGGNGAGRIYWMERAA